ncbi:MAG: glycosyltransferase family 2 protein [Actinobacteria bacterium]|nr:glycosyltransferase family 2 protein [Actinomycetota bacterium]
MRLGGETLVVIPAWNEAATVATVVSEARAAGFNVLVVNDGSDDETSSLAAHAGAVVVDLPFNMGVGAALRCGFKYAVREGYTTAVQCDADGQHPVEHITALIDAADATGAHMVIGSRFATNAGSSMVLHPVRRLAMWTLSSSASRAAGTPITDASSGFRVIRGELLRQFASHLPTYYLGDTYEAIIAAGRSGYRVREIPAPLSERTHGKSSAGILRATKLTARAFVTAALHIHHRLEPPAIGLRDD